MFLVHSLAHSTHIPSGDQLALSLTVAGLTLGLYYIAKGEKNSRSRRDLERKLSMAQRTVKDLEDKLFGLEANDIKVSGPRPLNLIILLFLPSALPPYFKNYEKYILITTLHDPFNTP